jgi:hypothetical protein
MVAGTETVLTSGTPVAGFAAGARFSVRFEQAGANPTVVRARMWPTGTAEPATWLVTATDTTAALQVPGGTGISAYLSSGSTGTMVTATVDNVVVLPL